MYGQDCAPLAGAIRKSGFSCADSVISKISWQGEHWAWFKPRCDAIMTAHGACFHTCTHARKSCMRQTHAHGHACMRAGGEGEVFPAPCARRHLGAIARVLQLTPFWWLLQATIHPSLTPACLSERRGIVFGRRVGIVRISVHGECCAWTRGLIL